jgi:hypothetical protein
VALWLASDAADVEAAMEKVMMGPLRAQIDLESLLVQAAQRYPEAAVRLFRLGQGRGSVGVHLHVLKVAGVKLHGSSLSEGDWDRLCAADWRQLEDLWHCLADDAQPYRLVETMVRRAM